MRTTIIRQRLAANIAVSCLHTEYNQSVTAAIIYTDEKYKTEALDLCQVNGLSFIKIHEVVLTQYTEEDLIKIDPRLLVLAPFTLKNREKQTAETLQPTAERWKKELATAYSPQEYMDAVYVVSMFLLNRCKKLNYEEIHKMFHVDLMETQAGQDIFAMGRIEGKELGKEEGIGEGKAQMARKMLLTSLAMKFTDIPEGIHQQIEAIHSTETLEELFTQMMQCHDLAEFEAFLCELS